MKKRSKKIFRSAVSFMLLVSISGMSVHPSAGRVAAESGKGGVCLSPGSMVKPINFPFRGDRAMMEGLLRSRLALYGGIDESDLYRQNGDRTLKVLGSRSLKLDGQPGQEVVLVPGAVNGEAYYICLNASSGDMSVYDRNELEEFAEENTSFPDTDAAEAFKGLLALDIQDYSPGVWVLDTADDGVCAAAEFFHRAGAVSAEDRLRALAREKQVCLAPEAETDDFTIVVSDRFDPRRRAREIVSAMAVSTGFRDDVLLEVFDAYWPDGINAPGENFSFAGLPLKIKDHIERIDGASNEGMIQFLPEAYSAMVDLTAVSEEDCAPVMADIRRIFRKVALHELAEAEAAFKREEKEYPPEKKGFPGMDPGKIKFRRISECLIPSDVVSPDGMVEINMNFVKLLYRLKNELELDGFFGEIRLPEGGGVKPIGNLYESIIYSLAIHTIRGHFPVNDMGRAVFEPREILAQPERGRGHLYVNLLAMLFYWVIVVERHPFPRDRAEYFLDKYFFLASRLEPEERTMLPLHLERLEKELRSRESFPLDGGLVGTGVTRADINELMRSYEGRAFNEGSRPDGPGTSSNEGGISFSEQAYSTVRSAVRGVSAEDYAGTLARIKEVFGRIAAHQISLYNRTAPEGRPEIGPGDLEKMPGLDPSKIKVEPLSSGLLPTDIVHPDGTVILNENFVKIMHVLGAKGMKGSMGVIESFSLSPEKGIMGELYDSIIYSLAIHTIRGHFSINEYGFDEFAADEAWAQGERGEGHAYVNILAQLYYWIIILERSRTPHERAQEMIEEYPEIFRKLNMGQLADLPWHLLELCRKLKDRGVLPLPASVLSTGMVREDAESIIRSYPGAVSNEGGGAGGTERGISFLREVLGREALFLSREEEERVLEVLKGRDLAGKDERESARGEIYQITEKKRARYLIGSLSDIVSRRKETGGQGKMVIAVEADWVPETQRDYVRQVIREMDKLQEKGEILIVRSNSSDLADKLKEVIDKERVPLEDVLVMAGKNTLEDDFFREIRAGDDNDREKAFIAEIDPAGLTEDSYIRFLEMLDMAVRMAFNDEELQGTERLGVEMINSRTVLFMPRAEPLDYEMLEKIYRNQRKALIAA
ncbi:MAG: hypothetical protein GF408_03505 [Candidatus Omnitrophica bacterium]|nr:hypothetical protein [Candidatus Omnitrophota bacterium]